MTAALLTAALEYSRRGMSIIPIGRDKKPLVKWASYQTRRAGEPQLRTWFARGDVTGEAVILGPVSGNLYCRDFDDHATYSAWCDERQL